MDEVTDYKSRLHNLKSLKRFLMDRDKDLLSCLTKDLNRNEFDSYSAEILHLNNELNFAIKNIKNWMKPSKHKSGGVHWPSKTTSVYKPLGKCLIVSPWNYPLYLALSPLISSISAGNQSTIKPSELAPATSNYLFENINAYISKEVVSVVVGGVTEAKSLLSQKWDFIFFTGGVKTGEVYRDYAAKNKIPCVLELGGKNPVFFDDHFSKIFIRRLLWGKFFSSGQTCIAPDHLWLPRSSKKRFVKMVKDEFALMLSGDWSDLDLANEEQICRWNSMLSSEDSLEWVIQKKLVNDPNLYGGVAIVNEESIWMKEEVFGPLLPVVLYDNLDSVLADFKYTPLATYSFSENNDFHLKIESNTKSGSFVQNSVMTQIMSVDAPFGGVLESGLGRARGMEGYKSFSYLKTLVKRSSKIDFSFLYPPHKVDIKWLKKGMR